MSQLIKCDEGHWFDKSQNMRCPFCGVGPTDPGITRQYDKNSPAATAGGNPSTAESGEEDKTRRYDPMADARKRDRDNPSAGERDPEVTIAVWQKSSGIDPVVGWLVCSEGANQGRDYRLRSGYNVIGRDPKNQICIAGDETISRENHAKIFYDRKDASFHVIGGEGRSGIYVNGRVVLQPSALMAYDLLELGSTRLVFVPLCGERFRWDAAALSPAAEAPAGQPNRGPNGPGRA